MKYVTQLITFLKEVYSELKKVSWLSKKEVLASTIVVIVFVLIVAIFISTIDFISAKVLQIVIGR